MAGTITGHGGMDANALEVKRRSNKGQQQVICLILKDLDNFEYGLNVPEIVQQFEITPDQNYSRPN